MADMVVIDDGNFENWINPVVNDEVKTCSAWGMFKPGGLESSITDLADSDVRIIPETEWDDIIAQRKRDGSDIKTFAQDMGLHVLDQNGTNYCWCNGVVYAAMVCRLQQTGQVVRYSPASVAAPVKNFRNRGGWGEEALDFMIEHGINLQEDWPPNAIQRNLWNQENKELALEHRPVEYYRCRTWEEVVSSILQGWPVAVGYNWWGHLVCGVDIVERSHDLVIANSWGRDWSDDGYGVLRGRKKYPDGESVAVVSMTAM